MAAASSTSTTQDWTTEAEGGVPGAVTAGVVSSKLLMNYSNSDVVEFQYAPAGAPSNQCLADTSSDASSIIDETIDWWEPTTTIALEKCGMTAQSLWIIDENNVPTGDGYVDLINAGWESTYTYANATNTSTDDPLTSPFAEPDVLTVSSSGSTNTVELAPLSEIGGDVSASQMWTSYTAADQSALRAQIQQKAK
jgi:hypothetical protein